LFAFYFFLFFFPRKMNEQDLELTRELGDRAEQLGLREWKWKMAATIVRDFLTKLRRKQSSTLKNDSTSKCHGVLAFCHWKGLGGVKKDRKRAVGLAYGTDDVSDVSRWVIAKSLISGVSGVVVTNQLFGVRMMRALSSRDFAPAMYSMAQLCASGSCGSVPLDRERCVELMQGAAQYYAPAQHVLAEFYVGGTSSGVVRDIELANRYLRLAAEQGHERACFDLGRALRVTTAKESRNLDYDKEAARLYLTCAADSGHMRSATTLGWEFFLSEEDPSSLDFALGAHIIRTTAERDDGDSLAMYILGHCYTAAEYGCSKHPDAAGIYYANGAVRGYKSCLENLIGMLQDQSIESDAVQRLAIESLRKIAANRTNVDHAAMASDALEACVIEEIAED
jgi:TPR repeat protein